MVKGTSDSHSNSFRKLFSLLEYFSVFSPPDAGRSSDLNRHIVHTDVCPTGPKNRVLVLLELNEDF